MVEEELGDVAEVLAVDLLARAVHLEHTHAHVALVTAVDLVAGRVAQRALARVALQLLFVAEKIKAEFAWKGKRRSKENTKR